MAILTCWAGLNASFQQILPLNRRIKKLQYNVVNIFCKNSIFVFLSVINKFTIFFLSTVIKTVNKQGLSRIEWASHTETRPLTQRFSQNRRSLTETSHRDLSQIYRAAQREARRLKERPGLLKRGWASHREAGPLKERPGL